MGRGDELVLVCLIYAMFRLSLYFASSVLSRGFIQLTSE
jgi:hypothetical protein